EAPVSLAAPWSTADPREILGDRVAPNSYKIDRSLVSAPLAAQPMPTNAWWQNLVIEGGDQPVVTAPYMVKCLSGAVVVCAPTALAELKFVASVWHDDWRIELPGSQRSLVAFDAVSATVDYSGAASVPLARGAVFTTVVLHTSTALRLSTIHAIIGVRPGSAPGIWLVQLNNGATWLVCCEGGAALQQCGMSELHSDTCVSGAVRLALVPGNDDSAVESLVAARHAIVVGGDVAIHNSTFTIDWKVQGAGEPLVCALPHHQSALLEPQWADDVGTYWFIKGQMRVARGCQWRWREDLEPLGFAGSTPLTDVHRARLCELVAADARELPEDLAVLPQDPYFFGKALARAARIALIADEAGAHESRDLALQRACAWLEPWLAGTNRSPLVYDSEWHGIVSRAGLHDPHVDFGQGRYNDHHFHYGYFAYAAAAILKLAPHWGTRARLDQLDLLVRDFGNCSAHDTAFPLLRCFDFFDGHSWAAGLFPFADSRNQESTSEAINAYYGAFLYASVTDRHEIATCMRAVLQLEARTARTYWHLDDLAADIYPAPYAGSHAVVGILWSSKVDYTTFFGNNPEYIYGIQLIPYTPALALLVKRQWIERIWDKHLRAVADGSETESWREMIDLAYAVVDKPATFERISRVSTHDDGNSASNAYYWVATAPLN
ncbi:hypothetical protein IWW55_003957, partial [Coemansia sp. RSA 2706]